MGSLSRLAFVVGLGVFAGIAVQADVAVAPTPITLTNGLIALDVQPPDADAGVYRGTRFDWAGVISRLEYGGHRFYGPWFTKTADVRDFVYDGDDIVAGPASAVTGPAEEFSTDGKGLGFDDAPAGGTFVKIGVGVLRRPDDAAYSAFRTYEVVDHGRWAVSSTPTSAVFVHTLSHPASGHAYVYEKTIALAAARPEMTIAHRMRNTGTTTLRSRVYNHNFLVLDGLPTGPGLTVTLPYDVMSNRPPDPAWAEIRGRQIAYKKELPLRQTVSFPIHGFGASASDNQITVEHATQRAGVRIEGDRPLVSLSLWSIRSNVSVEPFIEMVIEPGSEFTWQYRYTYYTTAR